MGVQSTLAKATVGSARRLFQGRADAGVGPDVLPAQRRDLQVRHGALVLREVLEEALIGIEAFEQPLAVVEPIDTNDQAPILEPLRHVEHRRGGLVALDAAPDGIRIDPNREHPGAYAAPGVHDDVG